MIEILIPSHVMTINKVFMIMLKMKAGTNTSLALDIQVKMT